MSCSLCLGEATPLVFTIGALGTLMPSLERAFDLSHSKTGEGGQIRTQTSLSSTEVCIYLVIELAFLLKYFFHVCV